MADFMIMLGRNMHSDNVLYVKFMEPVDNTTIKIKILRWQVGARVGTPFVRFFGRSREVKKCPWLNFRLVVVNGVSPSLTDEVSPY